MYREAVGRSVNVHKLELFLILNALCDVDEPIHLTTLVTSSNHYILILC